jgi:hypothetical protein
MVIGVGEKWGNCGGEAEPKYVFNYLKKNNETN